MGLYDQPAIIKHMKLITGVQKITYIGHSQGTSQMFAGITLLPDFFKENINGFIALGPVTNLEHISAAFLDLIIFLQIDRFVEKLGITEIARNSNTASYLNTILCRTFNFACNGLIQLVADQTTKDDA